MEAFRIIVLMAMIGFAFSTFISEDAFNVPGSLTGRTLLQERKSCTVNFEFLNYTIITSRCKGPQYAASLCCPALKEFACPYSEEINDMSTDCASTMFSYINLYGKYPPGLFAAECQESAQGLQCTDQIISNKNSLSTSHSATARSASLLVLITLLTIFFLIY